MVIKNFKFSQISHKIRVAKNAFHNVLWNSQNIFFFIFVSNICVSRKKYFIVGERENDDNA